MTILQKTSSALGRERCCDKEVRNVGQPFDVTFDIDEVVVLAIELSKEEETSWRRSVGMTLHSTARNSNIEYRLDKLKVLFCLKSEQLGIVCSILGRAPPLEGHDKDSITSALFLRYQRLMLKPQLHLHKWHK